MALTDEDYRNLEKYKSLVYEIGNMSKDEVKEFRKTRGEELKKARKDYVEVANKLIYSEGS